MKVAILIFDPILKNVKDLYESIKTHFLITSEVVKDVYTISNENMGFGLKNISRFKNYKKTDRTMKFNCIVDNADLLKTYDHIVCINGACVFTDDVEENIFKENLFFVKHPGFYNKPRSRFSYETNKNSTAYIASHEGEHYFYDYFMGGSTTSVLEISYKIVDYIKQDEIKKTCAEWLDESYLNRYLASNSNANVLDLSYCWSDIFKKPEDLGNIKLLVKTFKKDNPHRVKPKPAIENKTAYTPSRPSVTPDNKELKKQIDPPSPKVQSGDHKPKKRISNPRGVTPPRPKYKALDRDLEEIIPISGSKMKVQAKMGAEDLTDLTFIIPVKLDSKERRENLEVTIDYLLSNFKTNIIVGEESHRPMFSYLDNIVTYMHIKPTLNCFYRTKILNLMTKKANTKFVINYDCDVIMDPTQYSLCIDLLRKSAYDFIYPYNGHFILTPREYLPGIRNTKHVNAINNDACRYVKAVSRGGAIAFNKKTFIAAGMENEYFRSWGPEDTERYIRFKKLGYKVGYLNMPLYHLEHPRGSDSNKSNIYYNQNETEFRKIQKMSSAQLKNYIRTWYWVDR